MNPVLQFFASAAFLAGFAATMLVVVFMVIILVLLRRKTVEGGCLGDMLSDTADPAAIRARASAERIAANRIRAARGKVEEIELATRIRGYDKESVCKAFAVLEEQDGQGLDGISLPLARGGFDMAETDEALEVWARTCRARVR